jgi:chorismate mutase / prephenate dehydratase
MPLTTIAFLGPEGTYAHLAAKQRFGENANLVPAGTTVKEVFDYVCGDRSRIGVVPIENSSGGTIYETVDRLVDASYGLFVREALSINVRLALMGKDKNKIKVIYSHFAPLHHCETWLHEHFPGVDLVEQSSTGKAAKKAATQTGAAAIGNLDSAKRYGLKVLEFPIEKDVQNVTQFYVLGHEHFVSKENSKTSIVFTLPDKTGSLVDFLLPFKKAKVNITRIISRPIIGKPDEYIFLADIKGTETQSNVKSALKKAASYASSFKSIGSYPVKARYES